MLRAWSGDENGYIYPSFQWVRARRQPRLNELLAKLESVHGFSLAEDPEGWARVFWLYRPMPRLSAFCLKANEGMEDLSGLAAAYAEKLSTKARAPAEMFSEDPDLVIDLTKREARHRLCR